MKIIYTIFTHCRLLFSNVVTTNFVKMTTAERQLSVLFKRLTEADKKAKLLNLEVSTIRNEISILQRNLTDISALQQSLDDDERLEKPIERKKQISRCKSTNSVEGPSLPKRLKSTDETDNVENNFTIQHGYVVVYTDGACENNGKHNAKAGIGVWFGDDNSLNISKPVVGNPTNNTAEIQACIAALRLLHSKGVTRVKLITDSQFTINCMTQWIHNWKKNNWKTASGGSVKNKEDLQALDSMVKMFEDVKWEHIAGHKGHKGNEEADKLAKRGAISYKRTV